MERKDSDEQNDGADETRGDGVSDRQRHEIVAQRGLPQRRVLAREHGARDEGLEERVDRLQQRGADENDGARRLERGAELDEIRERIIEHRNLRRIRLFVRKSRRFRRRRVASGWRTVVSC